MNSQPTERLLEAGQELDGFVVREVTPLAELRAVAYRLEHAASGARLLHLHAEDRENLFCVCFPTPPPDDSGVPHILEHCVLAGSEKLPVKEPLFEMARMSMATFLNALTGWECTYYPVASNVRADLFNLSDVYFDAVFHPLLSEDAFSRKMQEVRASLSDDETARIAEQAPALQRQAAAPNPPEVLALLPQLAISELPLRPQPLPTRVENLSGGCELLVNDVVTNGVNSLHVDLDLEGLPEELWPYLSLYSAATVRLGPGSA